MSTQLPVVGARKCGACQLCCVLPSIDELGKPVNTPCVHLTKQGCGIYEERPKVCREFRCNWHQGAGSQLERPDQLRAYTTLLGPEPPLGLMVFADPADPTRWQRNPFMRKLVRRVLANGHTILQLAGEEQSVFTHDPKVVEALKGLYPIRPDIL